jgi:hypothetical protein
MITFALKSIRYTFRNESMPQSPLGLPDRPLCHRSARQIRPKEFNADSQGKRILIHRSGREQTSGTASITHSVTIPIGRAALD